MSGAAAKKIPKSAAAKRAAKAAAKAEAAKYKDHSAEEISDEESDAGTLQSTSRLNEVLDKLQSDEDLVAIAKQHIQHNKKGGVKCLLKLNVESFLAETKLGQITQGVRFDKQTHYFTHFTTTDSFNDKVEMERSCKSSILMHVNIDIT